MADYKEKFTGKLIRGGKYTALSASVAAAANGVVDGRRHEFYTGSSALKILPYRIKRGDQAKFFPGLSDGTSNAGIETGSDAGIVRDTERGIVYVPIKKKNYQNNLIGVGSHISTSFSSSAYLQCSAAFASLYSNVSDDVIFNFAVEEFYTSPSASRSAFNVEEVTSSFDFDIFDEALTGNVALTASYSGFESGSSTQIGNIKEIAFDGRNKAASRFITHWQVYFPGGGSIVADQYRRDVTMKFGGPDALDQNWTGSILIDTYNEFSGTDFDSNTPTSGSKFPTTSNVAKFTYVNGTNGADGTYVAHEFKFLAGGDADSGSKYSQSGKVEVLVMTGSGIANQASVKFGYSDTSRAGAKASTDYKILYFYSGSGASSTQPSNGGAELNGLWVPNSGKGTPVFLDKAFRFRAPVGFYNVSGSSNTTIYVSTSSFAESGYGPTYAYDKQS